MIKIIKQLFEWFRANKLTVNLNKTCYTIFRSINKKVPDFLSSINIDDIIILFYNGYVFSKIQYGIEVYGQASTSNLRKVRIQQNRALKILHNKDYHTPTKSLHKELNLLLVEDIYKLGVLKFVYKQHNNLLPNIFNQFYIENASIHSHNTRQSHRLHVINPTNVVIS